MTDKFTLTLEQNLFAAKRGMVDYIYHSAKLEGCNVTFPETYTILEGVNVGSVTLDDIQTILNLRDAWRFVMCTLEEAFTPTYLCKINEYISRNESLAWGVLRTGGVGISGTEYKPPLPTPESAQALIDGLTGTATQRAIAFFLLGCRAQLFWDGNKRTSTLAANKILMQAGAGIFAIREKDALEFNTRLLDYYNTGDLSVIDRWLYDNCIEGIEL
ncbi:MAG: Fic family protein [Oscillospiraceae bacterium]|nr:Fic family protein [Oscillospiraceae bacterium]